MNNLTDNKTNDLFGDAEAQPATKEINHSLQVDFEQVQQQAEKYAKQGHYLLKDHKFGALYTYYSIDGQPIYWRVRFIDTDGKKIIRPFCLNDGRINPKFGKPDAGQFINFEPKFDGKKPIYGQQHLSKVKPDTRVLIVEGEKCCDIANDLGVVSVSTGGATSGDGANLEPLAGMNIDIWLDNDADGRKAGDVLIPALKAIGCTVRLIDIDALGLPEKGGIDDWLDLRNQDGLDTTKADIENLPTIAAEVAPVIDEPLHNDTASNIPKGHLCEPMAYGGDGGRFEVLSDGIFHVGKDQHDNDKVQFISTPILVIAKTRDNNGNAWGRLLQWLDDEKRMHQWAMPMQLLQGDGSEVRRELADQGVMISPERKSRDLLSIFLGSYPVDTFALCVDRLGWHGLRYVMPQQTYGEHDGQLTVFQQNSAMAASFYQMGTIEQWQQNISLPCENHSRLVFALSVSFAGQLLEPLNEQSGGFHIRGNSSSGKSTAAKIAGSTWGNPELVIRQWRATSNALEGIAALHNDSFLGLDEISQCEPKDVGNTIYMLSNGQGKARMQRTGASKPVTQWRVMFLSNGEKSLDSIMGQVGKSTNAGQEIRLADIPADAGHNLGIFDPLPIGQRPADYAEQLQQSASHYYGSAGIAWLEYLTKDKAAATSQAKELIQQFMQQYATNKGGQVQRVAKRFALVAAAGELSALAGITGWQQGRAMAAVGQCFNDWLAGFGDGSNIEDRNILSAVRAFFQANGSSRFENLSPPLLASGDDVPQKVINRVGYFRQDSNSKIYLVYPEQFKTEICKDHDPKQVAKVLVDAGWLELGDGGRNQKRETLPDGSRPRVYVFNNKMWDWDSDQSRDTLKNSGTSGTDGTALQPQWLQSVPEPKTVMGQRGTVGHNGTENEPCPSLSQSVPEPKTVMGQAQSVDTATLSQLSQLSHQKTTKTGKVIL